MLNPGEFLSVNNTSNFSTDGVIDLHLQAIVESPGKDSFQERSTQTDRFHEAGIVIHLNIVFLKIIIVNLTKKNKF